MRYYLVFVLLINLCGCGPDKTKLDDAYDNGKKAGSAGLELKSNPYNWHDRELETEWKVGWTVGASEKAEREATEKRLSEARK